MMVSQKELKKHRAYSRVKPFTASPAPWISLSSSSPSHRRPPSGLNMGLAIVSVALRVGLDVMLSPRGNVG